MGPFENCQARGDQRHRDLKRAKSKARRLDLLVEVGVLPLHLESSRGSRLCIRCEV